MPLTSILSFGVTRTGDIVAKPLPLRMPKREPNLSQVFSSLVFKDFKQIIICRVNNICIGLKILYLDNTIEILGNWLPTSEWICIYNGGKLDFGWIGFKVTRGQVIKITFSLQPAENGDINFGIGDVSSYITNKETSANIYVNRLLLGGFLKGIILFNNGRKKISQT